MLLTCVKNPKQAIKPIAIAALVALGMSCSGVALAKSPSSDKGKTVIELNAAATGVISVSDYEFNTFVLSEPAVRVLFPAGSPVAGNPITLANGTQVLIQFARGSDRPIQMVFELESGKVETLRLQPKAIAGITHAVGGAKLSARSGLIPRSSGGASGYSPQESSPRGADVELLKTLTTSGMPPSDFSPVALPAPTRFDKFSVVPLAGWSNGERQVYVFSLVAQKGQTAVVSPNQFYRHGISAILLDGDTVSAAHTPQLLVVEELSNE